MQDISPQNAVHLIGQVTPLYFNCSFENLNDADGYAWNRYNTLNNLEFFTITSKLRLSRPHLAIFPNEHDVEGSNLIVKDADFDDAGRYFCRNLLSPHYRKDAEAIVLGKFVGDVSPADSSQNVSKYCCVSSIYLPNQFISRVTFFFCSASVHFTDWPQALQYLSQSRADDVLKRFVHVILSCFQFVTSIASVNYLLWCLCQIMISCRELKPMCYAYS